MVLPFDAKDGVQAMLVKPPKWPDLLPIENPRLCTVQEGGNNDVFVSWIFVERPNE